MTKLAQSALLAVIFSLALAQAAAQTLTGTGMDVAGGAKATLPGKFGSTLASFW